MILLIKYYDRFSVEGEGKMVSYVVKNVELSTKEIQDNYKPFNSTITKYAPRIDTMYVDTKWKLDVAGKVEKGKSQATVIATQTKKTCKVYHPEKGMTVTTQKLTIPNLTQLITTHFLWIRKVTSSSQLPNLMKIIRNSHTGKFTKLMQMANILNL